MADRQGGNVTKTADWIERVYIGVQTGRGDWMLSKQKSGKGRAATMASPSEDTNRVALSPGPSIVHLIVLCIPIQVAFRSFLGAGCEVRG